MSITKPSDKSRPLTLIEAADYLNVSERYVRRLVAERRIAFHKVGHLLRFQAEDLQAFFEAGRVEPPPPRAFGRNRHDGR